MEPPTLEQRAHAARMHELRTPLTVLVGRVQLLRHHLRGCENPVRVHEDLEAIAAALARLTAAVARMDQPD